MERKDRELLLRIVPSNAHLNKLYREHLRLEKEVEHIETYVAHSPSVAFRLQNLKKEKLRGMDSIMSILGDYRKREQPQARKGREQPGAAA